MWAYITEKYVPNRTGPNGVPRGKPSRGSDGTEAKGAPAVGESMERCARAESLGPARHYTELISHHTRRHVVRQVGGRCDRSGVDLGGQTTLHSCVNAKDYTISFLSREI